MTPVSRAAQVLFSAAARGLRPPDAIPVAEWAEKHVVLGPLTSDPGPFRISRAPYLRRVLDVMGSEHPCRSLATAFGTQLGKSTAQLIVAAYYLIQLPSSVMMLLPDKALAKEWSDKRFADIFASSPSLAGKLTDANDRKNADGENVTYSKIVPGGGMLKIAWASSATMLRSTPVRVLLADESDEYKADLDKQGDPVRLAARRQTNYHGAKRFLASSPKIKHTSIIWRELLEGDQEYYFVPCPACGLHQVLRHASFVWPAGQPELVKFRCQGCSDLIPEGYKGDMLEQGIWVATADHPALLEKGFYASDMEAIAPILDQMAREPQVSMHLNSYYSAPGWYSWAEAAFEWERDHRSPSTLKTYVNTVLAEPWEEYGVAPDAEKMYGKREFYDRGQVPRGGLFLTAAVDVQANPARIEWEVAAWGRDGERWSIDYGTEMGDPAEREVWDALDRKVLLKNWPTEYAPNITMPVMVMAVDSGHLPTIVYDYVRDKPQPTHGSGGHWVTAARTVVATKGATRESSSTRLIANISSDDAARKRGNIVIYHIGTAYAKMHIFSRFRQPMPAEGESFPPGYWHTPDYPFSYFEGICSETQVGMKFVKTQSSARNEPLDLAVGNFFAAGLFGVERFQEAEWQALEAHFGGTAKNQPQTPPEPPDGSSGPGGGGGLRQLGRRTAGGGRRIVGRFQ